MEFGEGGDFRHLEFGPGTRYGGNGKLPLAWRELVLVFTKVIGCHHELVTG